MRSQNLAAITLLFLLPAGPWAASKAYNEAQVLRLEGTIMVEHANGSKPTALQTGSMVEKGDVLTVYDKSWVILRTHKGDRIGIDGGSVVVIDEYHIEGPDRQIRFVLQKGVLMLKTNGSDSRQTFFEINAGSVVSAINDTQTILTYDPEKDRLRVQYMNGKLTVIDKDSEQKFKVEHSEHNWEGGKKAEEEPLPLDELDVVNYKRFFEIEPRLKPQSNNMVLQELENRRNSANR
jgi:hypothetical protein